MTVTNMKNRRQKDNSRSFSRSRGLSGKIEIKLYLKLKPKVAKGVQFGAARGYR